MPHTGCADTRREEKAAPPEPTALAPTERWKTSQHSVELLDLGFFVYDVLTDYGVVLLELKLVRRIPLVLVRRIKMAGTGAGYELDLVAHDNAPLDLLAALA